MALPPWTVELIRRGLTDVARKAGDGETLEKIKSQATEMLSDLLIKRGVDGDKIFRPQFDETFQIVAGTSATSVSRPEPRVETSQLQRDWHNDYAAFVLELSSKLNEIDSPTDRQALIGRLSDAPN